MLKGKKSEKYKGVYSFVSSGKYLKWCCTIYNRETGRNCVIHKKTEREAALAYDLKLIEMGREPVNILKRK